MVNEQRLIDATEARKRSTHDFITHFLDRCPTVDAVEVAKIEEVKQEILQVLDNLIDADKPLAYWSVNDASSYYSGKIQALEVARRLVNAALTDLCCAKMDGDEHE